jgi:E3 ubiquitin-protein ligase makorin
MQGYCARGKTCYFRHEAALAGVNNKKPGDARVRSKSKSNGNGATETIPAAAREGRLGWAYGISVTDATGSSSIDASSAQICTICLETPGTFGLLLNCDHVFCLECIRDWRSSTSAPLPSNEELRDTTKTCPLCRSHSDFIIPSSEFPVIASTDGKLGEENTAKKAIVDRYLSRLKSIPCRYFERSVECSMPNFRPKCKFGNGCHYAHTHPITKEPYIFSDVQINRSRRRRSLPRPHTPDAEEIAMMESLFNALGNGYDSDVDDWGCDDDEDLFDFETGFGLSFSAGHGADDIDDFDQDFAYWS